MHDRCLKGKGNSIQFCLCQSAGNPGISCTFSCYMVVYDRAQFQVPDSTNLFQVPEISSTKFQMHFLYTCHKQ